MDLQIRQLQQDEWDAYAHTVQIGLSFQATEEELAEWKRMFEFDRSIAALDGSAIVGTGGAFSLDMTLPGGRTIPTGALTAISVLPTHRRRGVLRSMIRRHFDDVLERGEPVSILNASESSIYGRFGYGPAAFRAELQIDRPHTAFARPIDVTGRVRLLDRSEALKVIPGVYERHRLAQPGELSRPLTWWEEAINDPEYLRKDSAPRLWLAYESAPGELDGFADYRVKDNWQGGLAGNVIQVRQLFALTPTALAALARFLFDLDLAATIELQRRPLDDPVRWLLADHRRLRTTATGDMLWLRILDLPATMAARAYSSSDRIVLEVRDSMRPENNRRWLLDATPTAAECTPTGADPDLILDVADLGAAYLGGVRLATLARSGRVLERTRGAGARADRLLASDPLPWSTTGF
jgi:predicted acetyltransferase